MSSWNSKPRKVIRFINVSHPEAKEHVSEHRTAVHSHASRVAHARARHARTTEYQAGRAVSTHQKQPGYFPENKQSTGTAPQSTTRNAIGKVLDGGTATERVTVVMPSPVVGALGSERRDPFLSFASSFTPIEHFLLDHCEY